MDRVLALDFREVVHFSGLPHHSLGKSLNFSVHNIPIFNMGKMVLCIVRINTLKKVMFSDPVVREVLKVLEIDRCSAGFYSAQP